MRKLIIALLLSSPICLFAQYKIAVVSATTGQTKICPTLDSAYKTAIAGDYIYLPAGSFTLSQPINKKLFIYGAGINPDSSLMGITKINSSTIVVAGSDGSYFEGIQFSSIYLGNTNVTSTDDQSAKILGLTFMRCDLSGGFSVSNINLVQSNQPKEVRFYECRIWTVSGVSEKWEFVKNIVVNDINRLTNSMFLNNVFLSSYPLWQITNSTFENNIFRNSVNNMPYSTYWNLPVNCVFRNNVNASFDIYNNVVINPLLIGANNLFVNIGATEWYQNDYHLQPGCPGINAGSDGKDVGIYGTSQPTKPGWIPSNPHVYYKNVAGQNNSSGILNATFKVKAQSN